MFFRREKLKTATFDDRMSSLREAGFTVDSLPSGVRRVSKYGCAAEIRESGSEPEIGKASVVIGNEIGFLVNAGYQQIFMTPGGVRRAALAQQLRALHDFQEDLKEALGLESLYNTSLGTISDQHLYDRVEDRDFGRQKDFGAVAKRP